MSRARIRPVRHPYVRTPENQLERRTARCGRHARLRNTSALSAAALAGGLFAAGAAWATPEGGTVVEGAAEIVQTSPTSIEIRQQSDVVIIEWQSFDIGEGESVTFIQPSDIAAALNRVLSGQTSAILGNLTANGQIVISNPNGISFGKNARVDVASIVATSLGILNQNFLAGKMVFDQPGQPGAVVSNAGTITAKSGGLAALVAPGVENSGVITAKLGAVALGAGNAAVLDFYGDGLVQFAITAPVTQTPVGADGQPVGALVSNTGGLYADGGTVVLTAEAAEGVLDRVVNMDGVVRAQTIENQAGQVALVGGAHGTVQVAGTIDASGADAGEKGGTVHVLGESVKLADGASIDVSGDAGGGTVLVGGDKQGKALDRDSGLAYKKNDKGGTTIIVAKGLESDGYIQHVQVAYFDAGAKADASAITDGNGGKVVVWADQTLEYHGTIVAKGGSSGGNGGFVETSAGQITVDGRVFASAAAGSTGIWLIDPALVNGAGTFTVVSGAPSGNQVQASAIENALLGADVQLVADAIFFDVGITSQAGSVGRLQFQDVDSLDGIDVDLNDKTLTFVGALQGVDLIGSGTIRNGFIIHDLNSPDSSTAAGIGIGGRYAAVDDVTVRNFWFGIKGSAESVTITKVHIYNVATGIDVEANSIRVSGSTISDIGRPGTAYVYGIRAQGADILIGGIGPDDGNLVEDVHSSSGNAIGIAAYGNSAFEGNPLVGVVGNSVTNVTASPGYLNLDDIEDSTGAAFGILASGPGLVFVSRNKINATGGEIAGDLLAVGIAALGLDGLAEDTGAIQEQVVSQLAVASFSGLDAILPLGTISIFDNDVRHIVSPDGDEGYGGVAVGILGLGGSTEIIGNEVFGVVGPVAAVGILGVATNNSNAFAGDSRCGDLFALCVADNLVDDIYSNAAYASVSVGEPSEDEESEDEEYDDITGVGGFAFGILTLGTTTEIARNLVGVLPKYGDVIVADTKFVAGEGVTGSTLAAGIFGLGVGPIELRDQSGGPGAPGGFTALLSSSIEPFDDAVLAIRDNLVDGVYSGGNAYVPTLPYTTSSEQTGSEWTDALGIEDLLQGGYAFGIVGASLWDVEIGSKYSYQVGGTYEGFNGVGILGTIHISVGGGGSTITGDTITAGKGIFGTNLAVGVAGVSLGKRLVIAGGDSGSGPGNFSASQGIAGLGSVELPDLEDILPFLSLIDIEKAPANPHRPFTWIHDTVVNNVSSHPQIAGLVSPQTTSLDLGSSAGGNAIGIFGFSTKDVLIEHNYIGFQGSLFGGTHFVGASVHDETGIFGSNSALGIVGVALGKSKEDDETGAISKVLVIDGNLVSGVFAPQASGPTQVSGDDVGYGGVAIGILGYAKGYAEITNNDVGGHAASVGGLLTPFDQVYGVTFSAGIIGLSDGKVRHGYDEQQDLGLAGFGSSGGGLLGSELLSVLSSLREGGNTGGDLGDEAAGAALIIADNTVHHIGWDLIPSEGSPYLVSGLDSVGIGGFAPSVSILRNDVSDISAQRSAFGILGAGITDPFAALTFFQNNPSVDWGQIGFRFPELWCAGTGPVIIADNGVYNVVASPEDLWNAWWYSDTVALGIGALGYRVNVSHNDVGNDPRPGSDWGIYASDIGEGTAYNQAGGILAVSWAGQGSPSYGSYNESGEGGYGPDFTDPYVLAVGNTINHVYAGASSYGQDKSTAFGLLTYSPSAGVILNHVSDVQAPGNWGTLGGDGIVILGSHAGKDDKGPSMQSEGSGQGYGQFTGAFADANTSILNSGNGMYVRDLTAAYISRNTLGGIVSNAGSVDTPVSDGSEGNGFGYGPYAWKQAGDGLRVEDVKKLKIFNNHINFNYGNGVNLVGGVKFLEMYENYIHQNHQNGILIGKDNHIFYSFDLPPEEETESPAFAGSHYGGFKYDLSALDLGTLDSSFKININSIVGNGIVSDTSYGDFESTSSGYGSYGETFYAIRNDAKGVVDARRNWFGSVDPEVIAALIKRPLPLDFSSESGSSYFKKPNVLFEPFLDSGFDANIEVITGLQAFGFQPGAETIISTFFFFDQSDLQFPEWVLGLDPTGPGWAQFFTQNQGNIIGPFYSPDAGAFVYSFGSAGPAQGGELSPAAGPGAGGEGGDNACADEFFQGQNYANSQACAN